ncbi:MULTISPECIES: hypothetical protein [unclassified Kitasatospora]|uniref:hypothetical protein n=1 Tax=unclassified Kitasatospora TaxID=2633591 RepID=UPI002474B2FE|nr:MULTISPECIES: hypothetical protein [unclassified Kitasatospora]MDH6123827.1 putative alpha/beta hydrolase family esterase [Kitasatospora sp. GP82]MDH6576074.1 putative alpha/beta hydrolase family esterase [Kitasatospora sp. MAP5-34]
MNDFRETILTLSGERIVIRTERTGRMTVAKLEADHTKAVKARVAVWRASVGKPKAFPNHSRDIYQYDTIRKPFPAVRYTSVDPDALVADWADVEHKYIDPNAPVVEPAPVVAHVQTGAGFLASLLANVAA